MVTPNQVTLAAMAFDKALEGVELTTATKLMAIRAALEAALVGQTGNEAHALAESIYLWQSSTQNAPKWDNLNENTKAEFLRVAALPTPERLALGGQWMTYAEMQSTYRAPRSSAFPAS